MHWSILTPLSRLMDLGDLSVTAPSYRSFDLHVSNCLTFTFPFLTNLQNSWLLFNPSVQPGEHHSPAAGEAEQPGEQEEQKCHRVREHREDPAAHHAGEERGQQGELRGG